MRAKQLLEKLNDLATYLTLAAKDAAAEQYKETRIESGGYWASYHEGEQSAFKAAFNKVDKLIKEATRG